MCVCVCVLWEVRGGYCVCDSQHCDMMFWLYEADCNVLAL